MITFKNIAGNKFLAVGTIQRKSALNGEKSLTGNLYDGKDVLNKIDKGWSLEFDGEPYVVTYFERNDNDNSVSFDAIHKFFWDMTKSVLYSETSGSHTIKWYLDQIFADTGYSYTLNFNPNAIQKENWGMKNKLSLFNDIISSIEGEFEINGTLISIFKNIGTDLSTIVRYGFNLSDMTLENDATSFVTYGEGFGEYADPENMTGDRLHVTYTSPLASVYGKLQAEPIDNRNYTIAENLLAAIKKQVDDSFSVSVNLSLYDLSVAGYPYKMANVGDWLTAVDENLDFKQRIRIISIDDDFAADGTRISYAVTAGNVGVTKRYQDANASLASKVEKAVVSSGQAITDANIALIAANGKNKSYYLNNVDDLPQTANEGDLAWVQSGDGRVLYIYTKKSDGSYYWEKRIDPEMGEQIEAGVNEAIAQANEKTVTAIGQNNISQQEVMNDIAKLQADLAIKDGDFNNNAQAMADKALADAKANTTTVAQETLNTANQNIVAAKSDLTDGLKKEVSDRNSAVSALDSKAQGYVNAAKNDINDTINALSVGGRNYLLNSNGSTLSSWTPVSGWQVVSDSTRGSVFSFTPTATWTGGSTNSISQSRTDLTTGKNVTVSFWAKASVDGAKFHSEPAGGNATENSSFNITLTTTWKRYSYTFVLKTNRVYFMPVDAGTIYYLDDLQLETGNMMSDYKQAPEDVVLDYTTKDSEIKTTISQYQTTNDGKVIKAQTDATTALGQVATKVSQTDYDTKTGDLTTKYTQVKQTTDSQATDIVDIKATATSQASKINSISSDVDGTKQSISDIETTQDSQSDKINQITSDVNGTKQSITDIQTKDGQQDTRMGTIETSVSGVKSDFSTYKTDVNGRISTAQTTAQTAVDGLKTKVSQTDYNTKTGQLQTDLTTTTQTANKAKTDIVSIQQKDGDQDARMTQIESDASGVKTTVSDLKTTQGQQSGSISTLQQKAEGFETTVQSVQSTVNNLGQINQLINTEFSPDFQGWIYENEFINNKSFSDPSSFMSLDPFKYQQSNIANVSISSNGYVMNNPIPLSKAATKVTAKAMIGVTTNNNGSAAIRVRAYDVNKKIIANSSTTEATMSTSLVSFQETLDVPSGAAYIGLVITFSGTAGGIRISQPILVFGSNVGNYSQGNYNNNNKLSSQQLTIDGITNIVSNPQNGLSIRVQTAEGTLSTVKSTADGAMSKASQTANDITQEIKDRGNGDSNTLQSAKDFTQSSITSYNEGVKSQLSQTASGILAQVDTMNMVTNSEFDPLNYGWYKITGKTAGSAIGEVWTATVSTTFVDRPIVSGSRLVLYTSADWISSNLSSAMAGISYSASIIAGRFIPSVTTVFDIRIGFWDSNKKLISISAGSEGMIGNSYKDMAKYSTENRVSPTGTAYVSLIIVHSNANVNDVIGRPMLSSGSTAIPYTPTYGTSSSSTVLSLFKDNWSIGISDNIGAITSGIVGNASQMSLISKNVTIDSPNTQIKGTAWIQSAMIANGAIGTAQIGDASITSAKIIDLDVARLTGNTTQFIKSNWDSAYSNVSIDPDSILLNAKSGSTTLTSVSIGALGMKIEMPGMASFLSDTMINSSGIAFHHAGGTYGSFGMLGNGFTTQYSPTGGAPLGITVGDGRNNDAANMAFGISVSQYAGQAPQLIWAGANTGKVSSSYRTWDNPAGFIIADNIKFSTWDNTASIVEFDSTITYRNWAPDQTYGYIDGNGTKRWFKVSGYTLNGTNKLVGIFGGDGQNGLAVDQTGDVFFSIKGNSYSVHTMLAKLNML
ncbi:phage tail protein [Leuconostoc mesenteroides]|uniref:phage tail protein n=1 Tax=Leuconostoc mesenteroides TaxID=1245 RepID=UPI00077873E0|nr:phage tail protein [Leuconostoc mesenteroides]